MQANTNTTAEFNKLVTQVSDILVFLFQHDEEFIVRLRDVQIYAKTHYDIPAEKINKALAILASRGLIKQVAIGADMYIIPNK